MSTSRSLGILIGVAAIAAAGPANAYPSFQPINWGSTNLQQGIAPVDEGSYGLGAIVLYQNGAVFHHRHDSTGLPLALTTALPNPAAVGGKGVAAFFIAETATLHVFRTDQNGLEYARSFNGGATWDGWYQVDPRTDLISAPVAVTTGNLGMIQVFAQNAAHDLVTWTADYTGAGWRRLTLPLGKAMIPPAAASWGPGRVDVFGRDVSNHLVHWWFLNNNSTVMNWGYDEVFTVSGTNRSFYVGPGRHDIVVEAPGWGWLHVYFRNAAGTIDHLYYRTSWWAYVSHADAGVEFSAFKIPQSPSGAVDWFYTCRDKTATIAASCSGISSTDSSWTQDGPYLAPDRIVELNAIRSGAHRALFIVDDTGVAWWTESP